MFKVFVIVISNINESGKKIEMQNCFTPLIFRHIVILLVPLCLLGCGGTSSNESPREGVGGTSELAFFQDVAVAPPSVSVVANAPVSDLPNAATQAYNQLGSNSLMALPNVNAQQSVANKSNIIDPQLLALQLSLLDVGSNEMSNEQLSFYWQQYGSLDLSLAGLPTLFNSDAVFKPASSESYLSNTVLWTQQDHLFKSSFIDWTKRQLTPKVFTADLNANFNEVRQSINDETGADLRFNPDLRIIHSAVHSLDLSSIDADAQSVISIVYRNRFDELFETTGLAFQGEYRQLNHPEGKLTLMPIANSDLLLAVIEPARDQFYYYVSELPAFLAEAMSSQPTATEVNLPLSSVSSARFDTRDMLISLGVPLVFDEALADLRGFDNGGQYINAMFQQSDFVLDSGRVGFISSATLVSSWSADNVFAETNGDGTNATIIAVDVSLYDCLNNLNPIVIENLMFALVDSKTGAIGLLVDLQELAGTQRSLCGATLN